MAQPSSPENHSLPECLACGTCCFSQLPEYVRVSGDDYDRLGESAEDLVVFHGNRAFMRMHEARASGATVGHCAALRVDPRSATFACTVYGERPQTCRDLERGSSACDGERATKRERPLLAAAALTAHTRERSR